MQSIQTTSAAIEDVQAPVTIQESHAASCSSAPEQNNAQMYALFTKHIYCFIPLGFVIYLIEKNNLHLLYRSNQNQQEAVQEFLASIHLLPQENIANQLLENDTIDTRHQEQQESQTNQLSMLDQDNREENSNILSQYSLIPSNSNHVLKLHTHQINNHVLHGVHVDNKNVNDTSDLQHPSSSSNLLKIQQTREKGANNSKFIGNLFRNIKTSVRINPLEFTNNTRTSKPNISYQLSPPIRLIYPSEQKQRLLEQLQKQKGQEKKENEKDKNKGSKIIKDILVLNKDRDRQPSNNILIDKNNMQLQPYRRLASKDSNLNDNYEENERNLFEEDESKEPKVTNEDDDLFEDAIPNAYSQINNELNNNSRNRKRSRHESNASDQQSVVSLASGSSSSVVLRPRSSIRISKLINKSGDSLNSLQNKSPKEKDDMRLSYRYRQVLYVKNVQILKKSIEELTYYDNKLISNRIEYENTSEHVQSEYKEYGPVYSSLEKLYELIKKPNEQTNNDINSPVSKRNKNNDCNISPLEITPDYVDASDEHHMLFDKDYNKCTNKMNDSNVIRNKHALESSFALKRINNMAKVQSRKEKLNTSDKSLNQRKTSTRSFNSDKSKIVENESFKSSERQSKETNRTSKKQQTAVSSSTKSSRTLESEAGLGGRKVTRAQNLSKTSKNIKNQNKTALSSTSDSSSSSVSEKTFVTSNAPKRRHYMFGIRKRSSNDNIARAKSSNKRQSNIKEKPKEKHAPTAHTSLNLSKLKYKLSVHEQKSDLKVLQSSTNNKNSNMNVIAKKSLTVVDEQPWQTPLFVQTNSKEIPLSQMPSPEPINLPDELLRIDNFSMPGASRLSANGMISTPNEIATAKNHEVIINTRYFNSTEGLEAAAKITNNNDIDQSVETNPNASANAHDQDVHSFFFDNLIHNYDQPNAQDDNILTVLPNPCVENEIVIDYESSILNSTNNRLETSNNQAEYDFTGSQGSNRSGLTKVCQLQRLNTFKTSASGEPAINFVVPSLTGEADNSGCGVDSLIAGRKVSKLISKTTLNDLNKSLIMDDNNSLINQVTNQYTSDGFNIIDYTPNNQYRNLMLLMQNIKIKPFKIKLKRLSQRKFKKYLEVKFREKESINDAVSSPAIVSSSEIDKGKRSKRLSNDNNTSGSNSSSEINDKMPSGTQRHYILCASQETSRLLTGQERFVEPGKLLRTRKLRPGDNVFALFKDKNYYPARVKDIYMVEINDSNNQESKNEIKIINFDDEMNSESDEDYEIHRRARKDNKNHVIKYICEFYENQRLKKSISDEQVSSSSQSPRRKGERVLSSYLRRDQIVKYDALDDDDMLMVLNKDTNRYRIATFKKYIANMGTSDAKNNNDGYRTCTSMLKYVVNIHSSFERV
jgi:hypothetical protein